MRTFCTTFKQSMMISKFTAPAQARLPFDSMMQLWDPSRVASLALWGLFTAFTGRHFVQERGFPEGCGWTSTFSCLSVRRMHFCTVVVHAEDRTSCLGSSRCLWQRDGTEGPMGTDAIVLAFADGWMGILRMQDMHVWDGCFTIGMFLAAMGVDPRGTGWNLVSPVDRSPRSEGNRIPFPRREPTPSASFVYRRGILGLVPCQGVGWGVEKRTFGDVMGLV